MTRVEDFLRAMGGMFAFMGSHYRLVRARGEGVGIAPEVLPRVFKRYPV